MQIYGYYHIYTVNAWRDILHEMLDSLSNGLLEVTSRLTVIATGPEADQVQMVLPYENVTIVIHELNRFEFPSLELLWRDAFALEDVAVYYIHSKGVSYSDDRHARWRMLLCNGVIRDYRAHVDKLQAGYDISGINYIQGDFGPYFSGNFWFARASYVRCLPDPASLDQSNRYQAESWLGCMTHRHFSPPFVEPNP